MAAFLLLLHEKMRLQRKQNKLTLKQMNYSHLVERMQNKTKKREAYYSKLEKQIDRQANCYKNSMSMMISNQMGLGTNSVNLGNPYASNGAAQSIIQNMSNEQIKELLQNAGMDVSQANDSIFNIIRNGGIQPAYSDGDGYKKGDVIDINGKKVTDLGGLNATQISNATQKLQQYASMKVSQMQSYASQVKANYENNVSIWQEAANEQLQAQKEWEMDELADEQADLEAEKDSTDAQLALVKENLQSVSQALQQSAQDAAPKFGLS